MKSLLLFALISIGQTDRSDKVAPSFKNFKVSGLFKGPSVAPHFTNPEVLNISQPEVTDLLPDSDPRYRDAVTLEEAMGPNFAGHFTIAPWSCGSGCLSMVIIDAKSGFIYRLAPFSTLDTEWHADAVDGITPGLTYRLNSSLLIAEGCFDTDLRVSQSKAPDCGRKAYNWTSAGFVLLGHKAVGRAKP